MSLMVPFGDLRFVEVAYGEKYMVGSAPVSQAGEWVVVYTWVRGTMWGARSKTGPQGLEGD